MFGLCTSLSRNLWKLQIFGPHPHGRIRIPGGEDPRISDFSCRLVTYSSLLESIFCTMVHVCTSSFKKCTISFFFFEIQLLYEVVLVSGVQQSDSDFIYIYIQFIRFFSIIGFYKILAIVPCAIRSDQSLSRVRLFATP